MMRRFFWWGPCWGLLLVLAGCASPELACTDPLGCVLVAPEAPLTLAALLDSSGPGAAFSAEVAQGMALALARRENRLLDHGVALVTFDAACDQAGGQAAAQQMGQSEEIVAALGTVCAESAVGALPLIAATGGLLISPANSDPALTSLSSSRPAPYYRTIPSYLRQAEALARFAVQELAAETAVIFYNDTPYSEGLRETFGSAFLAAGGTVPFQTRFSSGSSLEVMLQVAVLNEPDVIFLPLYEAEATTFLEQAAEFPGLEGVTYVGPDSLLLPSFLQGTGTAVSDFYLSGYAVRGEGYSAFLATWQQVYGAPPATPYAAFAYDAMDLLLSAIESAAQRDSRGALLIGRQALRQTLSGTQDFPGLTGSLTCSPAGECAAAGAVAVFRLTSGGQLSPSWPPPLVWAPFAGE